MEWNIQSRAHVCQVSHEPFNDGDSYHTLLVHKGREGYQRLDVCQRVWEEKYSRATSDHEGYVSHWQGVYRKPPPPPPDAIHKESAESLLRKLLETQDSRYQAPIYILAVMLERKRILKVRDQLEMEGRRLFVYEHMKTRDMLTIPEVPLQLDQLDEVQQEVALLLEHGLEGPPAPGAIAGNPEAPLEAGENPKAAEAVDEPVEPTIPETPPQKATTD